MKGLSPESSINGNSSPTPIVEERLEATEESEPLLRVSDEESLNAVSPPPLWWMLDMQVGVHSKTSRMLELTSCHM